MSSVLLLPTVNRGSSGDAASAVDSDGWLASSNVCPHLEQLTPSPIISSRNFWRALQCGHFVFKTFHQQGHGPWNVENLVLRRCLLCTILYWETKCMFPASFCDEPAPPPVKQAEIKRGQPNGCPPQRLHPVTTLPTSRPTKRSGLIQARRNIKQTLNQLSRAWHSKR